MQCNMMELRSFVPRLKKKFTHQMAIRVAEDLYTAVEEVAVLENRRPNEVARFLLERGIASYIEDGKLIEESEPDFELIHQKIESLAK
jgi:hypothetical protein